VYERVKRERKEEEEEDEEEEQTGVHNRKNRGIIYPKTVGFTYPFCIILQRIPFFAGRPQNDRA
jgi:hypothetical protein